MKKTIKDSSMNMTEQQIFLKFLESCLNKNKDKLKLG